MSAIKEWLGEGDNFSDETKAGLANADPKIRDIIGRMIIRKRIKCADGFSMSVQYSGGHYCNGREAIMGGDRASRDDPIPEPTTVEIGFPNRREPLLASYAEDPKRLTKTVYGWVPVEVVDEVLAKHGGIKK